VSKRGRARACASGANANAQYRALICQCGILVRRKFSARSTFAPKILDFFSVRSGLFCAIVRWARTLQGCEFRMDFFIQLLYRLLIPRMRIPPFLEKTERAISFRSFLASAGSTVKPNRSVTTLGLADRVDCRVGQGRRSHFDPDRGGCFGVI
jgi:hypothetical protein